MAAGDVEIAFTEVDGDSVDAVGVDDGELGLRRVVAGFAFPVADLSTQTEFL